MRAAIRYPVWPALCRSWMTLAAGVAMLAFAGCAGKGPAAKPLQRGWIGGEYTTVGVFPPGVKHEHRTAVLVTALSTNTPAQLAGLHEGDLILEFDHQPVSRVPRFQRAINALEPGTVVPVKLCRSGETLESNVCVGRETYRKGGLVALAFPPIFRGLDLWPDPGFSFVVLGCEREQTRTELGSVESEYRRRCDPKGYDPKDNEWTAWLIVLQIWRQNHILSQAPVASKKATAPGAQP